MELTAEEAIVALRALYRTSAYHNEATAYAGKYVAAVRIVPEWLEAMTARTDEWLVCHGGTFYKTSARSREDAVNNVRFRLYEKTPEDECGEFDAVNPAYVILDAIGAKRMGVEQMAPRDLFGKKMISKADALSRIRKMAS